MKWTLLIFVVIMGVESQRYTTKYDNIDVYAVLRNHRLFNSIVNCLLDKGRCTADGSELKRILPDALVTSCQSCTAKQKENVMKVIGFLMTEHPDIWRVLSNKYDPQGIYAMRLSQYL